MRWTVAMLSSSVLALACVACEHGSGVRYTRDGPPVSADVDAAALNDAGVEADGAQAAPNPCAAFDTALGRSGDADGDGFEDWVEGYLGSVDRAPDADRDGTPDFCDLDADDDCRPDARPTRDGPKKG